MVDITKRPYFSYGHVLDSLFDPIRSRGDIKPLWFTRKYPNQERFLIINDDKPIIDYFSQGFYRYGLFEKDTQTYQSGFHMWDHLPSDPHKFYEYMRKEHSLAHGLTIVQQVGEFCDFFAFAAQPNNSQINNFYLNKKDLFTNFIQDFYDALSPTLAELSNHRIVLPCDVNDSKSSLILLSPRQYDCASLLAQGLTSKEIARSLNLSHRTVEHYIEDIKEKFNVKNRAQLMSAFLKHFQ